MSHSEEEYNIEICARWLKKNFPELESFKLTTTLKVRNGFLKALKILSREELGKKVTLNNKCDVDTFLGLEVDYNGGQRDTKIYILQGLLLMSGYDCDFSGLFERNTRREFTKYLKDKDISRDITCPYKVTSFVWCSFFVNE